MLEGIGIVDPGGTLNIISGTTSATPTISNQLNINAIGGTVQIGVPSAESSSTSGFVTRGKQSKTPNDPEGVK